MPESSAPRILQATARNRVVVGYAVPPNRLAPLLPEGLAPMQHEGAAYVSLVGVELTDVRVLGLAGPGFRRVPVVELRAHVRSANAPSGPTGTWTVQAHVPRRLVAWGARLLYGESVAVTSMQPIRREQDTHAEVTYRFDSRGREQRLRVRADRSPSDAPSEELATRLLRPARRFGITRSGTLVQTPIDRPGTPAVHRIQEHHVTVQWPAVYGDIGTLLADRSPSAVLLSPGTPVTLRWRTAG